MNPFVVSSSMAALADSGIQINQSVVIIVGAISWITCYVLAAIFVMRYAKKVKANKEATLLTEEEQKAVFEKYGGEESESKEIVFTRKQKLVMVLFAVSFVIMIIGVIPWENFGITIFKNTDFLTGAPLGAWWFSDLSTWFFLIAIITGLVYGLKEHEIVSSFISGASDLMSVALIIAVARGISVVMSTTGLDMYILKAASQALQGTNSVLYTGFAYMVYLLLSFLIPSSSGLATVTMPIIGPLTQSLGLAPEVAVCILSGSCALINAVTPTSGVLMGGISIARIEYSTWLKYIWKIFLLLLVVHLSLIHI